MLNSGLIPKSQIEIHFIRATRTDERTGLRRALCRGEFIEAVMRCAQNYVNDHHPNSKFISDHLEDFF